MGEASNISSSSGDIKIISGIENYVIKTVSGNINITDNLGNIYINDSSGDIKISGSTGVLDAHTVSGDIKVYGEITIKGINTVSGNIKLKNVNFIDKANLKSVSGDLTFIQVNDKDLLIDFTSVSGDISTGTMTLNMQKNKGEYIVKFGKGKKHLHISTISGDLKFKKATGSI